jgi:hypothetical protein
MVCDQNYAYKDYPGIIKGAGLNGFEKTATKEESPKSSTDKGNGGKEAVSNKIKVGSKVKVKRGAKTYTGGNLLPFVYDRIHTVSEISGDRVVITYGGVVVAAVKITDLIIVK